MEHPLSDKQDIEGGKNDEKVSAGNCKPGQNLTRPENNLQEPINLYSVAHESRRSMTCLQKDISYFPAAMVPTSGLGRTFPAGMPE
jgi:hypothetical protein